MGLIPFLSPISIVSQKHVKRKMAQAILNSQARRCQCNAHQRRHDETIDLISRQNEFNEIVTEETDNLRQRFESKGRAVCIIDVELNETREEITRLEDEIRRDEPEVLQMSLAELRSVNDHLAEDLRILADKFPPASKCIDHAEIESAEMDSSMSRTSLSSCPSTPSTPKTPNSAKSSKEKMTGFFKRQISKIGSKSQKSSRKSSKDEILYDV